MSKLPPLRTTPGQALLLDFHMAGVSFVIGRNWNTVFEEMARRLETFSIESKEQWMSAGHDMNGIAGAQQNAEREAQARQRRQRYMDCSLRRLRPKDLQRKAQGV